MMKSLSKALSNILTEALHKAVPAISSSPVMPRFRLLGKKITPYHFMQPALIPIRKNS